MKIYGRIYLITNLVNGKQYVGATTQTIKRRFSNHCSNSNTKTSFDMAIIRAIRKHGKENFKIEQIDVAYSKKELKLLEGVYISWFKTLDPNGYNIVNIVNGKGKLSEKTIEKMKTAKNNPKSLELQSEIGKRCRGKPKSESSSKYVGVSRIKNKYRSTISINKKRISLGCYNNEIDAAKAYDIATIKYFGNDAVLNFEKLRQDYINSKIIVNKNTHQDNSKSGIKNIRFHKQSNGWEFWWFDKNLNKNKSKWFKKLEDAIKFKECT